MRRGRLPFTAPSVHCAVLPPSRRLAMLARMSETILLSTPSGDSAEIRLHGAELSAWRAKGVDLVWAKHPGVWDQTAPVLFPVVGWTRDGRVRVKGRDYPLALHGFAWKKTFRTAEVRGDFARLALEDDEETRALYPFAFRFEVEFRLEDGTLVNELVVTNRGDEPLPYACGLHPAFRWPLAGSTAQHALMFEAEERAEVPVIGPGGLFSRPIRKIPLENRRLSLERALFTRDALCFLHKNSDRVIFDNGAGARLVTEMRDFPHIGFWTLPPAQYLCIEPWTGHGGPEDFRGDLYEKPSMRILPPGASARHGATFRFEKSDESA
jgi:galactose mutarotase-like enzyme